MIKYVIKHDLHKGVSLLKEIDPLTFEPLSNGRFMIFSSLTVAKSYQHRVEALGIPTTVKTLTLGDL